MTMQQETRFMCDRCRHVISVPLNDQPALERGKPPGAWVTLHIHGPSAPAAHLCPDCAPRFEAFMHPETA